MKLITHESERVKLSSYGKVRYLLGGGWTAGASEGRVINEILE